jgi:hypothetical protein
MPKINIKIEEVNLEKYMKRIRCKHRRKANDYRNQKTTESCRKTQASQVNQKTCSSNLSWLLGVTGE